MGNVFENCLQPYKYIGAPREPVVVMLGLDGVGKTATFLKLTNVRHGTTIPTIGFHVETIKFNYRKFTLWDIGGTDCLRPLWKNYLHANTDALIFMVDASDRDRIVECAEEIQKVINNPNLNSIPILVLANKQDLPNVMSSDEIVEKLGLKLFNNRYHIQETSVYSHIELERGINWLTNEIRAPRV